MTADRRTARGPVLAQLLKIDVSPPSEEVTQIRADRGAAMYSHIATGTVVAAIPAAAVASGFAPLHIVVVLGGSAAAMTGLVGALRFAHRRVPPSRHR